jgi:hypothetical protein
VEERRRWDSDGVGDGECSVDKEADLRGEEEVIGEDAVCLWITTQSSDTPRRTSQAGPVKMCVKVLGRGMQGGECGVMSVRGYGGWR